MIPPRDRPPPGPISLATLLLVEGDTPMHFFEALLQHLNLSEAIEIRNYGGVGELRVFLRTIAATSEFRRLVTSLGIVRDAEASAASARQSVEYALESAALDPKIKTSIFILPDDQHLGMIETLCMEAVRTDPDLSDACACVDEFFACLDRNSVQLPDGPQRVKNTSQAFLATRSKAQMLPGIAAYQGYWPWNSSVFDPLKQFVQSL